MTRVKLPPQIQKELIESCKAKNSYTWNELADKLGTNACYLRTELKNGKRTLTEEMYKKICKLSGKNYDMYCTLLDDNWGRSKGGHNSISKPKIPQMLTMKYSAELAEIMGIMLGDGNVWSRKGFYYTRIAGHSIDDKDYLLNFVNPLFENTLSIDMGTYYSKTSKEMLLTKGSKDLVYTLDYYGFKSGNKKKNNLGIPKWIFRDKKYMRACLRGLIDTDGCVYPKTKKHKTPTIWIKSVIPQLRTDMQKVFHELGFTPSKWSKTNDLDVLQMSMGKREEVKRYYSEVGFKNPKHQRRYIQFTC